MPDVNQPKASTGKVFSSSNESLASVGTSTQQINWSIAACIAARPRRSTNQILSDGPTAVVAGAEAMPEIFGVAGQATGAAAETLTTIAPLTVPLAPAMPVIGAGIGAGVGAFAGATYAKDLRSLLNYGDIPDKVALPLILSNDTPLQPIITTADTRQQALDHELQVGKGGHAYAGNEAYSLQCNAVESADLKTQDFGVMVVHITQNAGVQASAGALGQTLENIGRTLQLSQNLRDVGNDGYAECTEWINPGDDAGNFQGLLVLDQNGNGLIETRDLARTSIKHDSLPRLGCNRIRSRHAYAIQATGKTRPCLIRRQFMNLVVNSL